MRRSRHSHRHILECGGKGEIYRDETLTVHIPIGVRILRVSGRGMPADKPGLPPGDLFAIVRIANDPRFEREGHDLSVETIDAVDAVLGATINVPTPEGQNVPAGASTGCAERDYRALAMAYAAISMSGFRFAFRSG
jgi:DnaJ-class molecular chaperone